MGLLLTLLLTQFTVQQNSAAKGSVGGVNCQGNALSCKVLNGKWVLNYDAGPVLPPYSPDGGPPYDKPLVFDGGMVGCLPAGLIDGGCVTVGAQSFGGAKLFTRLGVGTVAPAYDFDVNIDQNTDTGFVVENANAGVLARTYMVMLGNGGRYTGMFNFPVGWATNPLLADSTSWLTTHPGGHVFYSSNTLGASTGWRWMIDADIQKMQLTYAGVLVLAGNELTLGTLRVPVVHGSGTAMQAIEAASSTFSAGSKAITFSTAFGAAPVCVCSDSGGATLACATGTSTGSGVTFYGTGTNAFSYVCIGQR